MSPLRRKLLFAALYFSQGAPVGFIWWALPTKLRLTGFAIEEITFLTGLLALPWSLKFLWAPAVDLLRGRYWKLRHWIIAAQCLMALALLPLLWLDFKEHYRWLVGFLMFHALAAATQDVAVDALCISTTSSQERGAINGWMQAGMLMGRALLGGGALLLSSYLGDQFVVLLLLIAIGISLVVLLLLSEPEPMLPRRGRAFFRSLAMALRQQNVWYGLLFALTGAAAFEAAGAVAGPLLIDRGSSQRLNALLFSFPIILALIFGALLGGRLADRWGRKPAVAGSIIWIAVCCAVLAGSDHLLQGEQRLTALIASLISLYVGIGTFTASSYALFMDLTAPAIAATQFSAFMGATNACEAWSAVVGGRLIASHGYAAALLLMCLVSLGSLALLWAMQLHPANRGTTEGPAVPH